MAPIGPMGLKITIFDIDRLVVDNSLLTMLILVSAEPSAGVVVQLV
ncbi:MAG: hypothetical protein LBK24_01835 [Puniceicoccales bacterium]|nr:hypothetical protein [Puniceicoccales bacterium]